MAAAGEDRRWRPSRRKKFRVVASDGTDRPKDLIDRQFWASRPNQLWMADFTYVATRFRTVYVTFIFDVFSRRIVGWRAATRMTTDLVLDTLDHVIWTRSVEGVTDFADLVHHTDAVSQYVSFTLTERLLEAGVDASVSTVGDAYDNAVAESQAGLFETELIRTEGPWRGVEHVELETPNRDTWVNHERPDEALDDLTPVAAEELHYAARNKLTSTGLAKKHGLRKLRGGFRRHHRRTNLPQPRHSCTVARAVTRLLGPLC